MKKKTPSKKRTSKKGCEFSLCSYVSKSALKFLHISKTLVSFKDVLSVGFSKVCSSHRELDLYLQNRIESHKSTSQCVFLFGTPSNLFGSEKPSPLITQNFNQLIKRHGDNIKTSITLFYRNNIYDLLVEKKKSSNVTLMIHKLTKVYTDSTNFRKIFRYGEKMREMRDGVKVITFYFGTNFSQKLHFVHFFSVENLNDQYTSVSHKFRNSFNTLNNVPNEEILNTSFKNEENLNQSYNITLFFDSIKKLHDSKGAKVNFRNSKLAYFLKYDMKKSVFIFHFEKSEISEEERIARELRDDVDDDDDGGNEIFCLLRCAKKLTFIQKRNMQMVKYREEIYMLRERNVKLLKEKRVVQGKLVEKNENEKKLLKKIEMLEKQLKNVKKENEKNLDENLKLLERIKKSEKKIEKNEMFQNGMNMMELKDIYLNVEKNLNDLVEVRKKSEKSTIDLEGLLNNTTSVSNKYWKYSDDDEK